jgi:hypothetical protein
MKFKINLLVAALAAITSFGAHASLKFGDATTSGNSSVAFVALDDATTTSLTVDLSVQFSSLLSGGLLTTSASTPSVSAVWDFKNNTFKINGTAQAGTYAYSVNDASFLTAISGGTYRWGVIAGDSVSAGTISSQNILFTSTALDFDNSNLSGIKNASVGAGATNVSNLFATSNSTGTQTAGKFGANTATAGAAFLGTTLAAQGAGDFGAQFGTNDFLSAPGTVASVMRAQLNSPLANVYQLGNVDSLGAAIADPAQAATFTFDDATQTLTYAVSSVPEPGSYAMLLAGLAAVAFVARRRSFR